MVFPVDLKSGYWQVELEEEAKPLTAFTLGPLGFLECEHMPFGLINDLVTFQRLMESCLGGLHLIGELSIWMTLLSSVEHQRSIFTG